MLDYLQQSFPIIELDDIILRELSEHDSDDYFQYMSRPEMAPYLTEANLPSSKIQALEEVKYWQSLFRSRRSVYWAIALKNNNQLIGTAGFNAIYMNHMRAEISYDLDPNFWGRGIMLKSVKNILRFADLNLNLIRVQATVLINNQASIKLLERCGFSQEGILKKYEMVDGMHQDYYMYARVC